MIFLLLLLSSLISFSADSLRTEPLHWSYILEVNDQHEFYPPHEEIKKPTDSWQVLFSLVYLDRNLSKLKDCVIYHVPGTEPGRLKIKTIASFEKCEDQLLLPATYERGEIKSLSFAITSKEVVMDFSTNKGRSNKWHALIQDKFNGPAPKLHLSSSEVKSPKIIFLAPTTSSATQKLEPLKNKVLCHEVNDECQILSPSKCHECPEGWYEVPNGCPQGPKYCGILQCGSKDRPACRRGMKWQKKEGEFDCRTDSSFAFCKKGLLLVCEGSRAFCR